MIAVTGTSGHLGRLVVKGLLKKVPAGQIVATARTLEAVDDLRVLGVQVRRADYDSPQTLVEAFKDVDTLLLVSAVEPGKRIGQHKAVIDAAREAGVKLVAYTSILRADTSTLALAGEHLQTEEYLRQSGLEFVLLRNGWYLENTTGVLGMAVAQGAVIGSSAQGRYASASRADYADAAVAVLTQPGHVNKVYELAGGEPFSMAAFAQEASRQSGKPIVYNDLPATQYEAVLLSLGLPQMIVDVVVDASVKAAHGELDSASGDLARLIGRPTTSLAEAIKSALPA